MTAYDRIDDKNVLLLAVEIDVAKVVFNEYNLKDVVVAIAQKYMVVAWGTEHHETCHSYWDMLLGSSGETVSLHLLKTEGVAG